MRTGVPRGLRPGLRPILGRVVGSAKARRFRPPRIEGAASNHGPTCRAVIVEPRSFETLVGKIKMKKASPKAGFFHFGVPTGIRTPVIAVKGRCPRPLDDGDKRIGCLEGSPDLCCNLEILWWR